MNYFEKIFKNSKSEGEDKTNVLSEEKEIVNKEYAEGHGEKNPEGYILLLDENLIEWKKEDVQEAKDNYEKIKDLLPEDFHKMDFVERKEIADNLLNNQ